MFAPAWRGGRTGSGATRWEAVLLRDALPDATAAERAGEQQDRRLGEVDGRQDRATWNPLSHASDMLCGPGGFGLRAECPSARWHDFLAEKLLEFGSLVGRGLLPKIGHWVDAEKRRSSDYMLYSPQRIDVYINYNMCQ